MHLQWPCLAIMSWMGLVIGARSSALIACLQDIQGHPRSSLTTPSSPKYKTDRFGFNLIFNYKPRAIYHPATDADAAAAIRCAATHNTLVAPRSGGHSYEAYCQGGQDGALVLDLDQLQNFDLDPSTGVATVGAGTRLGPLYARLWRAGQYLVPAGTCPSVGIGGHALGGGLGMTSRKYGTASDNLVGMTLISAEGQLVRVNATSNPDLFWALRGAGAGSFGLVTEFQIQAYKAPPKVSTLLLYYSLDQYAEVLDAYADLAHTAPEELMAEMNMNKEAIEVQVNFLGPRAKAQAAVARFVRQIGSKPDSMEVREGSWLEAATQWAWLSGGSLERPKLGDARYARGRSLVYRQRMSRQEKAIVHHYLTHPPQGSSAAYIIVDIWGGKVDRPDTASAFDHHRGVLFCIEFIAEWGENTSRPSLTCPDCLRWNANFLQELQSAYRPGQPLEAYQNYIDRDLPNSLQAYYGDGLPRLQQIKKTWDPQNIFSFPQSIPLPQEP